MLTKILLIFLAVFLVMTWWKYSVIRKVQKEMLSRNPANEKLRGSPQNDVMVRCARCEIFIPVGEAVSARGAYYCSKDHAKKGPKS